MASKTTEADSRNIHQRLHAAMQAVKYIQKEQKNGMKYTIVSHDAVTAKVRPQLVEQGIVYYPVSIHREQVGNRTEVDLVLRFVNIDDPADFIEVAGIGYGIDSQDKGPGKAVSYAVKYCLLKALGLETGDDPDVESIEHGPDPEAVRPITPEQAVELLGLISETETDQAKFQRFFKVDSLADLAAADYERAKRMLQKKQQEQPKEQQGAVA